MLSRLFCVCRETRAFDDTKMEEITQKTLKYKLFCVDEWRFLDQLISQSVSDVGTRIAKHGIKKARNVLDNFSMVSARDQERQA